MSAERARFTKKNEKFPSDLKELTASIQRNCLISDAGFSGIYSMCTLILRLRNLYKWEQGMEPWSEPAPPDLLEWIDAREKAWESVVSEPLQSLKYDGETVDPLDGSMVNSWFRGSGLLYGAGYGRSLKPVFFLAEKIEERTVEGSRLHILGRERARELAAPFAMAQENAIYIRREPLRFYFWDQIQEISTGGKTALKQALDIHGVLDRKGNPERNLLIASLDSIVDAELETFVYHEVGELKEENLQSEVSGKIIDAFPHSPIEYLTRSVKDLLADTHPAGLMSYLIKEKKETSLFFYVGFLDGLRRLLFPEINSACIHFIEDRDWQHIIRAVASCRSNMLEQAGKISHIADLLAENRDHLQVEEYIEDEVLSPLGLGKQYS